MSINILPSNNIDFISDYNDDDNSDFDEEDLNVASKILCFIISKILFYFFCLESIYSTKRYVQISANGNFRNFRNFNYSMS